MPLGALDLADFKKVAKHTSLSSLEELAHLIPFRALALADQEIC